MESVYEIDKELICSDGKVNLYNFGVNAIQYDFNPIRSGGGGALKAPPSDFFLSRI